MYACMHVCVCMYVCMHACMHACMYTHTQTHTHTHKHKQALAACAARLYMDRGAWQVAQTRGRELLQVYA